MANAPYYSSMDPTKVYLGDVNGDGLADMIQVRADAVDVWLNAITGFKDRVIVDKSPWAPGFTDRVRLADVNGSGSRDVLWADGGEYRYLDLTGGIKPRLLTRVYNGLGGLTEIDYEQSTDQYLRAREEGPSTCTSATPSTSDCRGEWTTTCPFPSQVVREVRTRDQFDQVGNGWTEGVITVRYKYRDCYYDGKEHESRGFAWAQEEHVGDANSPTSYTDHWFDQGKEDEALSGKEYRTESWAYGSGTDKVYLSTAWTGFAVRSILTPHAADTAPGMAVDPGRIPRFAYAAETHTYGYDTHAFLAGSQTISGLLRWRSEGPGGSNVTSHTTDVSLPASSSVTTHLLSSTVVDDRAEPTETTAYGQVGADSYIKTHQTYSINEAAWILRPCESWVEGQNDSVAYNHKLLSYDGQAATWGASPGQASCPVGAQGQNHRGEFKVYYPGEDAKVIEEHVTDYTRHGLPRHTKALKKLEGWLYYEEPQGYQSLVTREVIRVGLTAAEAAALPDPGYGETPVKYLTTRASHDPGLGAVTEHRDENDQKSQVVYDALGRVVELWGPREPKSSACSSGGNPIFMKSATIAYSLRPNDSPYSVVHARTYEDGCDPSVVKEAWTYVDGLGRTRVTVIEGEANPVNEQTEWIATDYRSYDGKGAVRETYPPAFVDWPAGGLPPRLAPSCPGSDDLACTANPICPTQTRYDAFGRATSQVLADGTVTRNEYRGPLATAAFDGNDTDATSPFVSTPTVTRKDGHGRVYEIEAGYADSAGGSRASHFTGYGYDPLGGLVALTTCATGAREATCAPGDLVVKTQAFDSVGQRRELDDPDAGVWRFVYDEAGNLIESTDGKWNGGTEPGSKIAYGYDTANRLVAEVCTSCVGKPDGTVLARYFYDSPYRLVGGRGYMPSDVEYGTEPQDWVLGRLSRVEDETGVILLSYDRLGRQVAEVQHIEATLPDGVVTGDREYYIGRVAYDDAGRVVRQTYPAAEAGQVIVVERSYERRGLLKRIHGPDPLSPGTTYDYLTVDTYNAAGQRCGYAYGDTSQIRQTRTYDRQGRLKVAIATQVAGPGYPLQHYRYEYDRVGNVTAIRDLRDPEDVAEYTGGANGVHDRVMEYDSLYRLTKATYREQGILRREMRFAYNAIGNLTERSTTDATGAVNPAGEFYEKWLGAMAYAPERPHAFASAGTGPRSVSASYDANGNMTELVVVNATTGLNVRYEYAWDHYDRLVQVEKWDDAAPTGAPVATAFFAYDHAGQRVVKSERKGLDPAQDTLYVTEGFEVRNLQYERYVFDERQRIARIGVAKPFESTGPPETSRYVYVGDHLGSTNVVVKDTDGVDAGCVVATTSHLPYGGLEAESGPALCAGAEGDEWYRFTGKELEPELGLYYFGARYYNPAIGAFISVDPSRLFNGEDELAYGYVRGRVLSAMDLDGRRGCNADSASCAQAREAMAKAASGVPDDAAPFMKAALDGITVTIRNKSGFDQQVYPPRQPPPQVKADGYRPVPKDSRHIEYGPSVEAARGNYGPAIKEGLKQFAASAALGLAGRFISKLVPVKPAASDLSLAKPASPLRLPLVLSKQAAAPEAAGGGLRGASTWGNPKTLADHFSRHGADFGARTADEYAEIASGFLRRSQADRLPTKIDAKGVIRVYDPKTNTFGSYNPSGTTRTFYKPDPSVHHYPTNHP